jgi:hypothetical protein
MPLIQEVIFGCLPLAFSHWHIAKAKMLVSSPAGRELFSETFFLRKSLPYPILAKKQTWRARFRRAIKKYSI